MGHQQMRQEPNTDLCGIHDNLLLGSHKNRPLPGIVLNLYLSDLWVEEVINLMHAVRSHEGVSPLPFRYRSRGS
jgi:hypothetical protein